MATSRRPGTGILLAVLIATIAFVSPQATRAQSAAVQWKAVDRVVVFADVHGA